MNVLIRNDTWDIVDLPKAQRRVKYKWVFILKYKADGSVKAYKAQLVVKGYTQTYKALINRALIPILYNN